MDKIVIPESYNYIGVFLTFGCNLRCSYCLNRYEGAAPKYPHLSGDDWIKGLNRIVTREDLPITLQGGEPTLHKDFYKIVNGVDEHINIDILTNGMFDIQEFIKNVDPNRLKRSSKYASIRFSYHLETMDLFNLLEKVKVLLKKGYSVGIWGVDHPRDRILMARAQELGLKEGIDFRLKEFLGEYTGKLYGSYRYPELMGENNVKSCMCKPSEILVSPSGNIYRCHRDLYNNYKGYTHILDNNIKLLDTYKECLSPSCNPCDVKIKTDRFQEYGHSSVEVKIN